MKAFDTVDTGRLLEIGIALSREKDAGALLRTILTAAMDVTGSDGGTLYTLRDGALHFHIMSTRSLGIFRSADREPIDLPPVPLQQQNVCAHCALRRQLINIPDVYTSGQYDFSGPREYDSLTGYRTRSMLVIPMEDDQGEIIGVLQLINALGDAGEVIPFDAALEPVVLSLASQAAIRLTNVNYAAEVERLLSSIVSVLSTAIDARTPYNANHTRSMALYAERFLGRLPQIDPGWDLPQRRAPFLMSVWLHDVGKLVIPLEVMDKQTRLGAQTHQVLSRLELARMSCRLCGLRGQLTPADCQAREQRLMDAGRLIEKANGAGFVDDDTAAAVRRLADETYLDLDGNAQPLLTPQEVECLCVARGTLTPAERKTIESHALMTRRLLGSMSFTGSYAQVPGWAAQHHEMLDGSGYPDGLSNGDIPREVRLLSILDIFDALTARDRPYKPPMPPEKALDILRGMAAEGKLDGDLLALFEAAQPWAETVEPQKASP